MSRIQELTGEHGGMERAALRGLPQDNQQRKPRAYLPEEMLEEWAAKILRAPSCDVSHVDFGRLERWHEGLVTCHMATCPVCAAGDMCTTQMVFEKWIREGVSLRPFLDTPEPLNRYTRVAALQSHLTDVQQTHMAELVATGAAETLPSRSGLEVVSNFFLVGAGDPHDGAAGVQEVVAAAELAELAEQWTSTVQSQAKERLVMNFKGLNHHAESFPFQYDSVQRLQGKVPAGSQLAVLDLSSAFHLIHLNPDSWDVCGLRLRTQHWRMRRLPFGYSIAPAICSIFTAEVARQIRAQFAAVVHEVLVYLDDFLLVLRAHATQQHLEDICQYVNGMGGKIKPAKCQGPAKAVTYVGFELRVLDDASGGLVVAMTDAKRQKVLTEVRCIQKLLPLDPGARLYKAMRSLAGRLLWYWPALAASSSNMAGLYAWMSWARGRQNVGDSAAQKQRQSSKLAHAMRCLEFWVQRLQHKREQRLSVPKYRYVAFMDASRLPDGSSTCGGVLYRRRKAGWREVNGWAAVPGGHTQSTQEAEIKAVMLAWESMDNGAGVVCCDSAAAVTACARGYTRRFDAEMQQTLSQYLEGGKGARHVLWVAREHNTLADSLSRSL